MAGGLLESGLAFLSSVVFAFRPGEDMVALRLLLWRLDGDRERDRRLDSFLDCHEPERRNESVV